MTFYEEVTTLKKALLFITFFLIVGIATVFYFNGEKEATIKNLEEKHEEEARVLQEVSSNEEADEKHTDIEYTTEIVGLEGDDTYRFEEFSTIKSYIDVDEYTTEIVEDHSNKRIILFTNSERETKYKSIYIKHKDIVKLIQLDGNGLLYKGPIES